MSPTFSSQPTGRHPAASLLLTFAYKDDEISLVRAERFAEVVPGPTGPSPPPEDSYGYLFELRDREGKVLYHRVLHDPVSVNFEIFSPEEGGSIARRPRERVEGEFSILAPDLPDAEQLVFRAPYLSPENRAAPVRKLCFRLDDLRQGRIGGSDDNGPATGKG